MKTLSKKLNVLKVASALFMFLILIVGFTANAETISIEIDVSPNVLNIASSGTVVTVHTDVAYSAVAGASVKLNGVPIAWWKSDSRGQFVAKFDMKEVETLVNDDVLELGEILLELSGITKTGDEFSGSQVISVIDVASVGKK